MKQKIPYSNFSSFILRTPLFPLEFLESVFKNKNTPEQRLIEICKKEIIQEAIFLASPDLYKEMKKWLNCELTDKKQAEKLKYAIIRYLIRMSTRCTPFGIFAGFSIGNWDDKTEIELVKKSDYERHTRLDMNYLCAISQDFTKNPSIKEKIKFYPNSGIYKVGNQLRYVEYHYHNTRRIHHIVSVDNSEYLRKVLSSASDGAYLNSLATLLIDDEISYEEAHEFIDELVESQLLISELEPAVTGAEFLDQIILVLNIIVTQNIHNNILSILKQTKTALKKINSEKIGTTTDNYYKIAQNLKKLETKYEMKYLFQTDMVKPTLNCTIDKRIINDILSGVELLNRLSIKPASSNITQFTDAFYERYEEKEVPLLEALDTDIGVGYKQEISSGDISPLIDDFVLPLIQPSTYDIKWANIYSFLNSKYLKAISEQKTEIEITDNEIEAFDSNYDYLPDTFSTMVRILNNNSGQYNEKIYMNSVGGGSAANLLGRFCHADKKTYNYVKNITNKEKQINNNIIFAEIIHLPEARTGNILLRPVLREYEIPYLAKSSVPAKNQIKPNDLMISVRANRIILRSKQLNKEIIPRLSSAHNFSFNALPVYQFLCDLQTQGLRGGISFNWGPLVNEYKFLPRVIYKNLIFSLAKWNIKNDDIKDMLKIKKDDDLLKIVKEWRVKNKIPAKVVLTDSDNELFLNLENLLCIKTLFSLVKNRQGFQLKEFLFSKENAIVKSEDGSFTNEFIVSFYKDNAD